MTKQLHIYSVDTSAFYNSDEVSVYNKLSELTKQKASCEKTDAKEINKQIKEMKEQLKSTLNNDGIPQTRNLNVAFLNKRNIVSVFDSALTRTLNMTKEDIVYEDLIIVRAFFFDVLRDLVRNGFYLRDEKYVCFTASAGQIRTKKTVFIKESLLTKHQATLMCGLTVDDINLRGGVNVNKYLAYLALCNSATDVWGRFNIHKSIVVEDMETLVNGVVDFIDDTTYKIERIQMDVPINHTDGCGMMIPTVNDKNMMVRAPWIKGLLASFDFRKFILKANAENPTINHGIVFDIYGKRHDVLAEDIEVIFTKSQFKMWKYYDSWEDYISKYERYGCSIGKCNEEEEYFKDTKLNYQMLQTLSDMTDWELGEIAQRSSEKIRKIAKDRKTMLRVFGVNEREINQTYLQQALALYPELLGDVYTKDVLMQIKKKLVREARAGKLDVNGKYTFIIPDLYAFCEYLFMKNERPVGIIGCGEVYCSLFKRYNKLDCLRSPHLYREHAVRQNIYNDVNCKEWFTTNALYISSHDLISRVLQCDFDGDRSLVCADKLIVSIAERNMNDVVPLYYKMRKAENMHVDSKKIFEGLIAAYTGGSIGQKSNDITKICDSDGKPVNWDAVKYLCMETNFVIDYAKTLYKPIRPKNIDKIIKAHTKNKVPYFFIYAKDKTKEQVSKKNNSLVNRLEHFVPNQRLIFKSDQSEKFDYRNLMYNPDREPKDYDDSLIKFYTSIDLKNHFSINVDSDKHNNIHFLYKDIRNQIVNQYSNIDIYEIVDIIVDYLYHKKNSKHKETLWVGFGDILVENIKKNIGSKYIICSKCGKRVSKTAPNQKMCNDCSGYKPITEKKIRCIDCGEEIVVASLNTKTTRCKTCQHEYDKLRKRKWKENLKK